MVNQLQSSHRKGSSRLEQPAPQTQTPSGIVQNLEKVSFGLVVVSRIPIEPVCI